MMGDPRESELLITLINANELHVVGMDRPMRVEGAAPVAHAVLDEYADMNPESWDQHIGPALSDLPGSADFIGVPEGRNHYYKMFMDAQEDQTGLWSAFHWTSEDFLPPAEIAMWKSKLDEQTYEQEFLASFVTYKGMAYSSFDRFIHCSPDLPYNPRAPLYLCFDFNKKPGVAAVAQEAPVIDRTLFIGEVYLDRFCVTPDVCIELLRQWGSHEGLVYCYGDASGGAGGSTSVEGSDWELVEKFLRPTFGGRLAFRYPKQNPRVRARVNAVNSRLLASDGSVRMLVDPTKCPALIRDLEGVRLVESGAGDIDKNRHKDDGLTHISDGAGYYVAKEFPVRGPAAFARDEFGS